MDALTINEASVTTGWSPRMLRYIERAGLVEPARSDAGYRLYGPAELQKLRTLRELLRPERSPLEPLSDREREVLLLLAQGASNKEIADRLGVPPRKVEQIIRVSQRPLSLEMPVGEEEDSYLGDFIEDDEAESPTDSASQTMLRQVIDEIFESLTPREVRILQLRFGLVDGYSYTLEEVGKKFGVTRERIRQIEAQALGRLRHPSRSRKLRDYLT